MTFLEFLLLGVGVGAAYGIEALGIVLIHRASRVVNFAQTGFLAIGAYTFYALTRVGLPLVLCTLLGLAAAAAAGGITYLLVLRPLRGATELMRLVAVLGVFLVIDNAIQVITGQETYSAPSVLPTRTWHLGSSLSVQANRIYLVVIAVALAAVLEVTSRRTTFGLHTRAVAENETTFRGLGHSSDRVSLVNWMLGGGLAGLAGILLASITGLSTVQLETLLLPALAAAVVGWFNTFLGTVGVALLLGIVSAEITRYLPRSGLSSSLGLIVIVIVLLVRGRNLPTRDEVMARLPSVGTGTVRLLLVVPLTGVGCLIIARLSPVWANSVAITAATGLVYLSVVVITGYAGQISLGQFALAGLGALVAAKLSANFGLPLLAVFVVTMISTVPLGLIVGLPAFRTRGMSLAIATLGLGFVIGDAILSNTAVTGGGAVGVPVRSPELFGYSIDALIHSQRYAVFTFIVMIVAALAVSGLRRSFIGRRWLAVRVNERAAAAAGIRVVMTKASALIVSAVLAGAGGVLFAFGGPFVDFSAYTTDASIDAVVFTVIGGIGYIFGAFNGSLIASGAVLTLIVYRYVGWQADVLGLIAGALVILNTIVAPSGAADHFRGLWSKLFQKRQPAPSFQLDVVPGRVQRDVSETLTVDDISISFGGINAVAGVSLKVSGGQIVGLIGPNGAGKTTLIDCISGFSPDYSGRILLGERPLDGMEPSARARLGLSRSFQGIEMFDDLTVYDNLRVAAESGRKSHSPTLRRPSKGRLSVASPCVDALSIFGLTPDLSRLPTELSYGRRRLVGVTRALANGPRFLLLDEPAAGLSEEERELLAELIKRLARDHGIGVLLVEHDVPLVLGVCDQVLALDHGQMLIGGPPEVVRRDPKVLESYLGQGETSAAAPATAQTAAEATDRPSELTVSSLISGYGQRAVVQDVSVDVRSGEIVVVSGANGAGKSTLLHTIAGRIPSMSGRIDLDGTVLPASLEGRARHGVLLVPEERSIFRTLSVEENLRMSGRDVSESLRFFPELEPHLTRRAGLLSGGQQQMLSLARALGFRPKFLLIDELTLGLAPVAVARLLASVRTIASSESVGVILVEQHVRKALTIADRGYVLAGGRITIEGTVAYLNANLDEVERSYLGSAALGNSIAPSSK
jgi:ABC-type branched-subunit amino acid transport system ATPase component/ABC-type branched-subunit amino acid transport system permease subunit